MHILSQETDNCPSWIIERENDRTKYFMINLHERMLQDLAGISTNECCRTRRGSNPRPPCHQSDAHPTEPLRPADGTLKMLFSFPYQTSERDVSFKLRPSEWKAKLKFQEKSTKQTFKQEKYLYQMSPNDRKRIFGHVRPVKIQIRLRIRADQNLQWAPFV